MEQGGTKQQRTGLVIYSLGPRGSCEAPASQGGRTSHNMAYIIILLYCCRHRDVECLVFILISESGGFLSAFTH